MTTTKNSVILHVMLRSLAVTLKVETVICSEIVVNYTPSYPHRHYSLNDPNSLHSLFFYMHYKPGIFKFNFSKVNSKTCTYVRTNP